MSRLRRQFHAEHGYWPQARGGYWVDESTRRAIYERDGWVCQLCGDPVDSEAAPGSPGGASLDHVVPQASQLVPDHRPSNLQLAHHGCNARKGARLDLAEGAI